MHGYSSDSEESDDPRRPNPAVNPPVNKDETKTKRKKPTPQQSINHLWRQFANRKSTKALSILPFDPVQPSTSSDRANEPMMAGYERAVDECRRKVQKIVKDCKRVNMRYRDVGWDLDWDLKMDKGTCLNGLGEKEFDINSGSLSTGAPKAVKRVHEIFEKPTFLKSVSGSDVIQGGIGNCWLMASLSALANVEDGLKRLCVEYNTKIGVYGFVFYRDGEWVYSIIDDKLYLKARSWDSVSIQREILKQIEDGEDAESVYRKTYQTGSKALFFGQCKDQNETWLPLIEKAYAKAHGDYASMTGGWIGEGLEDLTGGVTTELLASDILDTDEFWDNEMSRVNREFMFGCSTGLLDNGYGERNGIAEAHAYVVMETKTLRSGERLVKLRNPWGKVRRGLWTGKYSDGSKEWNPDVQEELGHRFSSDSVFWIPYEDLLQKYLHLDRTRLFRDPGWRCCQRWVGVDVPWKPQYHEKFHIRLIRDSPVVLVLAQLDDRYFQGLTGQYSFRLQFRVHEQGRPGAEDYIVRSHGNYLMDRSVSVELPDMEAGDYTVFISVSAERDASRSSVEDVVKAELKSRCENEKLAQVGYAYDLAHSKAYAHMQEVARLRKAKERKRASECRKKERRKMWERRHLNREAGKKQSKKNASKNEKRKAAKAEERRKKEELMPKDKAVQTDDVEVREKVKEKNKCEKCGGERAEEKKEAGGEKAGEKGSEGEKAGEKEKEDDNFEKAKPQDQASEETTAGGDKPAAVEEPAAAAKPEDEASAGQKPAEEKSAEEKASGDKPKEEARESPGEKQPDASAGASGPSCQGAENSAGSAESSESIEGKTGAEPESESKDVTSASSETPDEKPPRDENGKQAAEDEKAVEQPKEVEAKDGDEKDTASEKVEPGETQPEASDKKEEPPEAGVEQKQEPSDKKEDAAEPKAEADKPEGKVDEKGKKDEEKVDEKVVERKDERKMDEKDEKKDERKIDEKDEKRDERKLDENDENKKEKKKEEKNEEKNEDKKDEKEGENTDKAPESETAPESKPAEGHPPECTCGKTEKAGADHDQPPPSPAHPPPEDSGADSSDSPVSDYEDLYSEDDMTRKPRVVPIQPVSTKELFDSDEEDMPDPWNAICVVGFRVYSKDENLELRVITEGGELPEDGMGTKGELDMDNAQANAGGEREPDEGRDKEHGFADYQTVVSKEEPEIKKEEGGEKESKGNDSEMKDASSQTKEEGKVEKEEKKEGEKGGGGGKEEKMEKEKKEEGKDEKKGEEKMAKVEKEEKEKKKDETTSSEESARPEADAASMPKESKADDELPKEVEKKADEKDQKTGDETQKFDEKSDEKKTEEDGKKDERKPEEEDDQKSVGSSEFDMCNTPDSPGSEHSCQSAPDPESPVF